MRKREHSVSVWDGAELLYERVNCNTINSSSGAEKAFLNHTKLNQLELLNVSIKLQTVTINSPIAIASYDQRQDSSVQKSIDLSGSLFLEIWTVRRSGLVVPPSKMSEARPINDAGDCSIRRKKFFKVKIIEILLEVVNVTRKIE